MRGRSSALGLLVALALPGWAAAALGREPPKLRLAEGRSELLKVSSSLLQARRLARARVNEAGIRDRLPSLAWNQGRVEVEVRLTDSSPRALESLGSGGLWLERAHPKYRIVFGSIALEDLDELAALPQVRLVRPHYRPYALAGAVENQADLSMGSDQARSSLSVDGAGVNVGILSDSFSKTVAVGGSLTPSDPETCPPPFSSRSLTGSNPQSSGDLPSQVTVNDDCDSVSSYCSSVQDEGAAMAELIHDVAPGAALSFHSTFNSRLDFADGIDELRACGADVLVDDTIYLVEPMFQDGLIAQAIERAVEDGATYFSAAGNQATFGIEESFDDYHAEDEEWDDPSGIDFHDFGGGAGDPYAAVTVPPGCGITAVLQWNEPFDDPLGGGARTDMDLYICEGDSGQPPTMPPFNPQQSPCPYFSQDAQGCGAGEFSSGLGDPIEILDYLNSSGVPKTVYLAVDHYCGDVNGDLQEDDAVSFRIVTFGFNCSLGDPGYSFESGIFDRAQIYGHAAAAGATAVAAVFYDEIDSDGDTDPPSGQIDVEPFASLGGDLPFYFDDDGSPIPGGPSSRFKPDLAAPDGSNTTFFGADIAEDVDAHPNFFGSSAAVSHAAAVAALMLDANPDLTPSEVGLILRSTAVDIESPGLDSLSGEGLIDALAAVTLSVPVAETTPDSIDWGVIGVADAITHMVTLQNTTTGPAQLQVAAMSLSDGTNFTLDTGLGTSPCGSSSPVLSPGQSCTFGLTFSPKVPGLFNESLTVVSNASDLVMPLTGQGMMAAISVTKSASPEEVPPSGGVVTFTVEVHNDSAATDPVTLGSLTDDIYGDLTDLANPDLVATTCAVGDPIQPGASYGCWFQALVDGGGGDPHVNLVTAAGTDDEGDPLLASDSATVEILSAALFEDDFESGTTEAWSETSQ